MWRRETRGTAAGKLVWRGAVRHGGCRRRMQCLASVCWRAWEVAVGLWLCEGARGGGGRRQEEVRRLRGQGAKFFFWAADKGEGAVVRWLREKRTRGR